MKYDGFFSLPLLSASAPISTLSHGPIPGRPTGARDAGMPGGHVVPVSSHFLTTFWQGPGKVKEAKTKAH